jgi:hypothetical protein
VTPFDLVIIADDAVATPIGTFTRYPDIQTARKAERAAIDFFYRHSRVVPFFSNTHAWCRVGFTYIGIHAPGKDVAVSFGEIIALDPDAFAGYTLTQEAP